MRLPHRARMLTRDVFIFVSHISRGDRQSQYSGCQIHSHTQTSMQLRTNMCTRVRFGKNSSLSHESGTFLHRAALYGMSSCKNEKSDQNSLKWKWGNTRTILKTDWSKFQPIRSSVFVNSYCLVNVGTNSVISMLKTNNVWWQSAAGFLFGQQSQCCWTRAGSAFSDERFFF